MTATTTIRNGPEAHEFLAANPGVWEYLAAVAAGFLAPAPAAEALGLDGASFERLLVAARARMRELARRFDHCGAAG